MEKDFGSWFLHQRSDWQSPNLNSLYAPFELGKQNSIPTHTSPITNRVSADGNFAEFPLHGLQHSKPSQPKEPNGWFYCLPRFRQAFTPVANSISKDKIPTGHTENCKEAVSPGLGSKCAQKRFLVFDQSGDKTTLLFSSGTGTPIQCSNSWTPKPHGDYILNREEPRNKRDAVHHFGPNLTDEYYENHGDDAGSEMREDTEEINALLFSDDDYSDDDDDEVTSTDHSPSTMTAYDKQKGFEVRDEGEEVASSAEPTKRRKLLDGNYDVPSLMDTATSVKPNVHFSRRPEHEDDAESSCGDGKNQESQECDSLLGDKRSRKEKIRETVSILQSIIPCGKEKDASVILDEAIHYLRSLKRKAEALGLDDL